MRALLREPGLHFLLAGALLFAAHAALVPPEPAPAPDNLIVVDHEVVKQLQAHSASPAAELAIEASIQEWIREEALVREARALGLDRSDRLVRQRLARLMADALDEGPLTGEEAEPDDATLEAYAQEQPSVYEVPTQYVVNVERVRPDGAAAETLGPATEAALRKTLGVRLADLVPALEPGQWSRDSVLDDGTLVRLQLVSRIARHVPPIATIRERVRADWLAARESERREARVRELIESRYRVVRRDLGESP